MWKFSKLVLLVMMLSLCATQSFAALFDTTTQSVPHKFSHFETGFPLTGGHVVADCGTCHIGGVFKGTPRNCSGCHAKGARILATPMSNNHIVTNDPCETCHTNTATFLGARFNHSNAYPGSCTNCHNGHITQGKPASHNTGMRATDSCEKCHIKVSWFPARYDHAGVVPGSCATQCHNGQLAKGRPGSHTTQLKSSSSCDTCHRFTSWYPTFYNHSAVVPGTCNTCHNGVVATNKTNTHFGLKASLSCDQCHTTAMWTSARYNHIGAGPGMCINCHNGASATGVGRNHSGAKMILSCDSCHNYLAWSPAGYNHAGVAAGTCLTCHSAQRPTSHAARGYNASCDACHSVSTRWSFNHALQQGKHTCNSCHSKHHNSTPCDNCHTVNGWGH